MKEELILINIENKDTETLSREVMSFAIDSYLKKYPDTKLQNIIFGNDLASVFIETLKGNDSKVKNKGLLYEMLEDIYDHWRSVKRYIIARQDDPSFEKYDFLTRFDLLNNLFLKRYRDLCFRLTGKDFAVYRQLPAFANAFLIVDKDVKHIYKELNKAEFISKIAVKTPFVSYSSSNKRKGVFKIIDSNPLDGIDMNNKKWFVIPILSGQTKIHVYISSEHISLGVSLSNLFQLDDSYSTSKPDGIIVFGSNTIDGIYFDKNKNIYIGSLKEREEIDYFGYLKKIILTVHNIKTIKDKKLPIHGAGISILLKNGITKNVVIIGDSGAGKSETIEALREIANEKINKITTIYDDMGLFEIIDRQVYTSGTEIGAFIRTDDLANDYVYKVFDRAIFLNPNGQNSRLVLPISSYKSVIKNYHVDYVFYANNYEERKQKIYIFHELEEAIKIFEQGQRIALGTTNENGLVNTFFANPFGPLQLKSETKPLIKKYYSLLFKNKILVGQLFTGLGLKNGKCNPKHAAKALCDKIIDENYIKE